VNVVPECTVWDKFSSKLNYAAANKVIKRQICPYKEFLQPTDELVNIHVCVLIT